MLRVSPGIRWPRAALLCLLTGLHAAILLLPPQTLRVFPQEPLALISLPEPKVQRQEPPPAKHPARPRSETTKAITLVPTSPADQRATEPIPRIDWDSEASISAEHQAQLANAPRPRSLDDHKGHGDHHDGLGLSSHYAPEFGRDQKVIHRFDTRGDIPLIRLSDRCVLPLGPFIPLPSCGFGKKIEPRGDLFEHMRDTLPAAQPPEESGPFEGLDEVNGARRPIPVEARGDVPALRGDAHSRQ
jgi:hypothetical protein